VAIPRFRTQLDDCSIPPNTNMYLSLFIPISIISVPSNPGLGFSLCYPTLASFLHASLRCHYSSNAFFVGAGPIVLLFVVFTRLSSIVSFPPRLCTFAPPPHVALSRFIVFNLQKASTRTSAIFSSSCSIYTWNNLYTYLASCFYSPCSHLHSSHCND